MAVYRVFINLRPAFPRKARQAGYLRQTALANPHATFHYLRPRQERLTFPRATEELPREAQEIRPHPHGVELGALMLLAADSKSHDVKGFLQTAFSRVSAAVAEEILKKAGWKKPVKPRQLAADRELAEALHRAIGDTKIMAPPTNCLSPIGDELMKKGLVSFLSVIETENGEDETQLDLDSAAKKRRPRKEKENGEKRLNVVQATIWSNADDDFGQFAGADWDVMRTTSLPPLPDCREGTGDSRFGASHGEVFPVAMADGSVQWLGYGIDPSTWASMGIR